MDTATDGKRSNPVYAPPTITVVSDEDILRNFQVTSAQGSWWAGGSGSL
jgi:hypothetical protein